MVKASSSITLSAVVDVASCTRYYLLQSSTLSPPAKPTTRSPTGAWNDTEPTYTSGSTNSLYFCDLTVFSDGTWSYSSVSLSSSYEAAKEAYNKAQNAQAVAEKALSNTEIIVGTQTEAMNDMLERYGEVCDQKLAGRILNVVPRTIAQMMKDGRLRRIGHCIDVRSICDYIENAADMNYAARARKSHPKGEISRGEFLAAARTGKWANKAMR